MFLRAGALRSRFARQFYARKLERNRFPMLVRFRRRFREIFPFFFSRRPQKNVDVSTFLINQQFFKKKNSPSNIVFVTVLILFKTHGQQLCYSLSDRRCHLKYYLPGHIHKCNLQNQLVFIRKFSRFYKREILGKYYNIV